MKRILPFALLALFGCEKIEKTAFNYPETRKDTTVVDDYFGTKVADPYRWLEDDNSEETADWVKRQNELTFGYLKTLPQRDKIRKRLETLYNYERYGTPFKKAGKFFFFKNDGMQDQSVLYVQDSLETEPKVLIDPNTLSEDGTVALGGTSVSKDGKYMAYQLAASGSDWNEIHLLDLETGEALEEVIQWVKFSGVSWKGNGFFYSRYDAPDEAKAYSGKNEFHKVYYHELGTSQAEDELIYWNEKEPLRNYYAWTPYTEDCIVIFESQSTSGVQLYYKADGDADFKQIAESFDFEYSLLDHKDGKLLASTNNGAPNYRVVEIDVKNPAPADWKEIIVEKDEVLEGVELAGGKLVASYLKDVAAQMNIHELDGTFIRSIDFPAKGTASFNGNREDEVAFYSFTSFTYPTTIFKYNVATGESELFKEPAIDFDADKYEVKQVFYPSKDGTKIPMFIVHKKGLELNGSNPCLLYGYGGFNISIKPDFRASRLVFLENGGIYAQANMRGGGEYGEEWHEAGTKLKKQNVFDDFIAGAEYLISEGYTNSDHLAISGRSNGGLLVGACMTQRPDLYKVCLPAVGVQDMLRFHKFTIGWAWTGDYGSSDNEDEFKALYAYSPLHNVKKQAYPATLVTTADHDDRVVPAHSFKFISELQEKQTGDQPVMIRIDVDAGHGAGKPLSKQLDEGTDIWAFVFEHLGVVIE
ncbi:MAG: S9 family peptidase [Flavobacteriales bacterium]|nr:S9 family peptidase [Flavobacteriales bacterium]MCB9192323.1 S9 family peptidase [Flavobacteriales bacterium]MCB9203735.1 S9 family peptidase [Flavobacteriales bacterium]